jgi:phospholipid/cholesterol/gamma-HCH transport system permease protein
MQAVISRIEGIGAWAGASVAQIGHMFLFLMRGLSCVLTCRLKLSRTSDQVYFIGVKSLFVICLVGLFTGMVIALQLYKALVKFGAEGSLGAVVALSIIMELGPVLAALMVAGRAGSSMAAEIGIMRISEQIDALDTMDICPTQFLVSPRLVATILSVPLLTAIFDVIGIYGGYLVGVQLLGLDAATYWSSMASKVGLQDIISGLIKPAFFGLLIAWISCYRGYYCDSLPGGGQGSKGVSLATTSAVVLSSVWILVSDYVLTSFLF